MLARIAAPLFKALAAVIHGLGSSYGQAAVDASWKRLAGMISQHRRHGERFFLCVDGNCRIGDGAEAEGVVGNALDAPRSHGFVSRALVSFCKET